jgi:glyoxylase-like metal-dependent hydrolase (beta-lactamase superfamily II)
MKQIVNIEVHFSVIGFCNCYILSALPETDESPGRKPAIVIDPGIFDESLLTLIEGNRYDVKQVLVTHNHEAHVRGLKTLKKIYDAEIYARASLVEGFRTQVLRGGDELVLSGIPLSVIEIPGHSEDSLIFRVEDALFTGTPSEREGSEARRA